MNAVLLLLLAEAHGQQQELARIRCQNRYVCAVDYAGALPAQLQIHDRDGRLIHSEQIDGAALTISARLVHNGTVTYTLTRELYDTRIERIHAEMRDAEARHAELAADRAAWRAGWGTPENVKSRELSCRRSLARQLEAAANMQSIQNFFTDGLYRAALESADYVDRFGTPYRCGAYENDPSAVLIGDRTCVATFGDTLQSMSTIAGVLAASWAASALKDYRDCPAAQARARDTQDERRSQEIGAQTQRLDRLQREKSRVTATFRDYGERPLTIEPEHLPGSRLGLGPLAMVSGSLSAVDTSSSADLGGRWIMLPVSRQLDGRLALTPEWAWSKPRDLVARADRDQWRLYLHGAYDVSHLSFDSDEHLQSLRFSEWRTGLSLRVISDEGLTGDISAGARMNERARIFESDSSATAGGPIAEDVYITEHTDLFGIISTHGWYAEASLTRLLADASRGYGLYRTAGIRLSDEPRRTPTERYTLLASPDGTELAALPRAGVLRVQLFLGLGYGF